MVCGCRWSYQTSDNKLSSWQRWPEQSPPRRPIPGIVPDLVIEILSDGNTAEEMEAKLQVYQQAGVQMIWYIDPQSQDAVCHRSEGESADTDRTGVLLGQHILPGFELSLADLFDRADRQRPVEG